MQVKNEEDEELILEKFCIETMLVKSICQPSSDYRKKYIEGKKERDCHPRQWRGWIRKVGHEIIY